MELGESYMIYDIRDESQIVVWVCNLSLKRLAFGLDDRYGQQCQRLSSSCIDKLAFHKKILYASFIASPSSPILESYRLHLLSGPPITLPNTTIPSLPLSYSSDELPHNHEAPPARSHLHLIPSPCINSLLPGSQTCLPMVISSELSHTS